MLYLLIPFTIQTFKSQPPPALFLPSESQWKTQQFLTHILLKSLCFSPSHQCPDSPQIPKKKHFNFKFSHHSNSTFTKTTDFISLIKIGIQIFSILESFLMEELPICVRCISFLTVRKIREVLFFIFSSIFKHLISSHYDSDFLHYELKLRDKISWGSIEVKKR